MTLRIAYPCGCRQDAGMGQRRDKLCQHGHLFQRPTSTRRPPRASKPKRYWFDALAKVEEEGCCRVCKRADRKLDCAHILGREHDEPMVKGGRILKTLYVDPLRIVPACGPFPDNCHGDIDHRKINLLPYLTLEEELQAVRDASGIEAARIRLEPVTYRQEVEATAATHQLQGEVP